MDWYYVKAGQRVGPVDAAALKALLSKGELTQTDLVWNQTMGRDWSKVSAIAELQEGEPSSPAPKADPVAPAAAEPVTKAEPVAKVEPKPEPKPVSGPKAEATQEQPVDEGGAKKSIFAAPSSSGGAKKTDAKSSGIASASGKGPGLKKKEAAPITAAELTKAPEKVSPSDPELLNPVAAEPTPVQPATGGTASKLHIKRADSTPPAKQPEPIKQPEPVREPAAEPRSKGPSLISAALAQQKQMVEPTPAPVAAPVAETPPASEGLSSIRSSLAALNKNVSRPVEEPPVEMPPLMSPARNVIPPLQHIVIPEEPAAAMTADEIVRQGREAGTSEKELLSILLSQGISKKDAKEAMKARAVVPSTRRTIVPPAADSAPSKSFAVTVGSLAAVLVISLGILGYMIWMRL